MRTAAGTRTTRWPPDAMRPEPAYGPVKQSRRNRMNTAFGIVLFLLVYGPIAYMVYDELTGRRSRVQSRVARWARLRRQRQRLTLVSRPRRQS